MKVAPNQTEVKTKLAEIYEITGQLQKALDLIDQGAWLHLTYRVFIGLTCLSQLSSLAKNARQKQLPAQAHQLMR